MGVSRQGESSVTGNQSGWPPLFKGSIAMNPEGGFADGAFLFFPMDKAYGIFFGLPIAQNRDFPHSRAVSTIVQLPSRMI